jgi:dihydrolipoamide dehydrogenase
MKPIRADVVVVGGGPGGYTAAFLAADKGRDVWLVEQDKRLGGVCLNRGCIPSKALLHATALMRQAKASAGMGISFSEPKVNVGKLRAWKDAILGTLGKGLTGVSKARGVTVLTGRGHFEDSHTVRVETADGQQFIAYETAIIAVGSTPAMPAAFDLGHPRVMTSTEALELEEIPRHLLVIGGGYIGLELGTVYATLGSRVVLAEATEALLLGLDADLTRPVLAYAERAFKEVRLKTAVTKMATSGKQIKVTFEADGRERQERYDRVLVAVGRAPNCKDLGLEHTQVQRDERGFIQVDARQATADPAIFAIGDVVGGALLAHKASKEARVAVEAICGEDSVFQDVVMPAVVFTDPEVAWCGLTEADARRQGRAVQVSRFPWSASGRALSLDRPDGLTKLVMDPDTERILGVGVVGSGAGELISEGVLAIEMGATARDLAESVHPHPTLSETLMECAEAFYGTATSLPPRRRAPQPAGEPSERAG